MTFCVLYDLMAKKRLVAVAPCARACLGKSDGKNGSANTLPPRPCRNKRRRTRSYFMLLLGGSKLAYHALSETGCQSHVPQGLFQAPARGDRITNPCQGTRVSRRLVALVGKPKVLAGKAVVDQTRRRQLRVELDGVRDRELFVSQSDLHHGVDGQGVLEFPGVVVDALFGAKASQRVERLEHEAEPVELRVAGRALGHSRFLLEALARSHVGIGVGQGQGFGGQIRGG